MTTTSSGWVRHDGSVHLSVTETAKLVRQALKQTFPGQKFSVRSDRYSGGASIDVTWTDGPTERRVDQVIGIYSGADFDGMIDLKVHSQHWIEPDGTVTLAKREGTNGSFTEILNDPPTAQSRLCSFGADFVRGQRSLSAEATAKFQAEIAAFLGQPYPAENEHRALLHADVWREDGTLYRTEDTVYASNLVHRLASHRDLS